MVEEAYDYYEMDIGEWCLLFIVITMWFVSMYYFIKRYNNIII